MSQVAIITDSTADFPAGVVEEFGIKIVSLTVRFGPEEFLDKVGLTASEFYKKLKISPHFPQTTQPSSEVFSKVYQEVAEKTKEILSIHLTGRLSGTFSNALSSAKRLMDNLPSFKIRVLDSKTSSLSLGFLVMEAAAMAKGGETLDTIETKINQLIPKLRLFAMLDTLEFLKRGGRIGKAKALLGALLNFKPIIKLQDGEVVPVTRARGKGIAILIEKFLAEGKMAKVGVAHAAAPEQALRLREMLQNYFAGDIPVAELGPVLGTHGGPGTIGICGVLK